jgi:predicted Zn-dependent peptidase
MVELVFEEIEHLKTTLPTQEEIATLQTLFLERKKAQSISNSFWINALLWAKTKQLPLRKALDFETPIAALTPDTLSEAAQMMFVSPYYSILSHLPEDNEP